MTGFDTYYKEIFQSRWESLKEALLEEKKNFSRPNFFYQKDSNLKEFYPMDLASVVAAEALQVKPGDQVLDLCSAPGGKCLILAQSLGTQGRLVANDRSKERRMRLLKVIQEYLPVDIQKQIQVTGHDATQWGLHEKNRYDKILLDAPCSSERHLLTDSKYIKEWTKSRSKNLSIRQYAMLCAALDALKPGGTLVYSTCALSPLENDQNIAKLIKKRKEAELCFTQNNRNDVSLEKTIYGWQIMPDLNQGWGPIYYSVITKKEAKL